MQFDWLLTTHLIARLGQALKHLLLHFFSTVMGCHLLLFATL